MKKINGFIKYHSNIIFPSITFILFFLMNQKFKILYLNDDKSSSLISIASSFIGVLITILTIYLAVPKSDFVKKRLKESKHEHIYLFNILTGIIILFAATMSWIFFDNSTILIILFLSGITNIIVTIYYTFSLIKLI